jgi:hypothetical protein
MLHLVEKLCEPPGYVMSRRSQVLRIDAIKISASSRFSLFSSGQADYSTSTST